MEEPLRNFIKVVLDFILLMAVGVWILVLFLTVKPFERGFFCNDESILHPYNSNTVTMTMLVLVGFCIPIAMILLIEMIRGILSLDGERRLKVLGFSVPMTLQNLYKYIGFFLFGAACCQLITDIAKYTIGRLRPHFISVCQPVMNDGTDCSNPINLHRYIKKYSCQGTEATERMLKDMRLSFPSGHASFSFYTMVFCALYLQLRLNWKGSKLLKHVLQFTLIILALYTALSRISDYKHHWTDVLAGSLLGISFALLTASIAKIFKKRRYDEMKIPARTNE